MALPMICETRGGKYGMVWRRNFLQTLTEMGHDVYFFDQDQILNEKPGTKLYCEKASELLEKTFEKEHGRKNFSLFFSYYKQGLIDPRAISEIRKQGVVSVNFSCNNVHQFYLVEKLSRFFDYNLHSEKDVGEKFLSADSTPLWWPMASNPSYFKPVKCNQRNIDASFVGANYALRAQYVTYLLNNNINLQVYGPGWSHGTDSKFKAISKNVYLPAVKYFHLNAQKRHTASLKLNQHRLQQEPAKKYGCYMHEPISDEQLVSLYSLSKVSLGFIEVYENHDPSKKILKHLHLREFEAPMCRALYCTGYSDELAEMFVPDKEIVTYKNKEEMLEKVKFYSKNPEAAETIRQASYERALADHTYHERFKQLFKAIGLNE